MVISLDIQKSPRDIDFIVLTIVQELLNMEMLGSLKIVTLVEVIKCIMLAFTTRKIGIRDGQFGL